MLAGHAGGHVDVAARRCVQHRLAILVGRLGGRALVVLRRGRIRNGGALGTRPLRVVHRHVQTVPLMRAGREATVIKRL